MSLQDSSVFTMHDIHLAGYMAVRGHVENHRILEMITDLTRILEVKITRQFDHHGIEIKIDSLQKDGTQSWIVITRSIDQNKKPILHKEASSSTGKQPIPSSSSSSTLPIKQRTAVPKVIDDNCYNISKKMIRILIHEGQPREDDGAIEL